MKKTLTAIVLLTMLAAVTALGQWQYVGVFPPGGVTPGDTIHNGNIHGLAVDRAGKVWVQNFSAYARDSILIPNWVFRVGNGTTITDSIGPHFRAVRALYCYLPNGQQASFSPLKFLTVNGVQDTIGGKSVLIRTGGPIAWDAANALCENSGRGLRADQNGNIIATYFGLIYRINYLTGAGMDKGVIDPANSAVAVGVTSDGYVFGNIVVAGGAPLKIFNPDLTFLQNAVDTLTSFSRAIEVSKDGNDIYFSGYTNHAIFRYRSPSGLFGSYLTRVDTIMKGFDCESYCWNPKPTKPYLWASAGSYLNPPNAWPGVTTSYTPGTWYAIDTSGNGTVKDSIKWVFQIPLSADERPRAIAFSPGGDTAYVGIFGASLPVGLRVYRRVITSVEQVNNLIPSGFELSQNFPNPFNPSTEIHFTVARGGMTTLKVYDILGKEVATLVNESLSPGTFKVGMDGKNLSSGTYFYVLASGDTRIIKKMMLLK